MGGEELKINIFVLLLLGVSLFVYIPSISAQEVQSELILDQEVQLPEIDPIRAAEQALPLDGSAPEGSRESAPSIWAAVRMILVLALTAVAIYGIVHFFRKTTKPAAAKNPFLKVLASAHLGSSRYAHIVSVGGKAWLLGASDGGVNLIGEVEDKEVIDAMLLEESKKGAEIPGRFPDFVSMLNRLGARPGAYNNGADKIRERRERLKGQ